MLKHFDINLEGRDFVCGDIHGCFNKLQKELDAIGFDENKDRLFSVGDLVDRGPESIDFSDWLRKPWFHAVKGNHEVLTIEAVKNGPDSNESGLHYINGGVWLCGLPTVEKQCIAIEMEELPLAIEVDTKYGLVGIIHAESPHNNWYIARKMLSDPSEHTKAVALWARTKISSGDETEIKGLHKLFVGHTPDNEVRCLGNVFYTDTGACFKGGKLTILQIN